MNTARTIALTLGLMSLLSVQSALACEITRTPWGLRVTDCKLSDFFAGKYDLAVEINPNRPMLRLPNLHPTDIDGYVLGGSVELLIELENNGNFNAGAFDVAVLATVHNPLNNGANVGTTALTLSIQSLAAAASVTQSAGIISLLNRKQDWDVCAVAIVDPPQGAPAPAWGRVFESNESDNMRDACCRVYGPKPDLNGPPACN